MNEQKENLRYIVRIAGKDLNGSLPIMRGLAGIKGIGLRMAQNIQAYILRIFMNREIVSLKNLHKKYAKEQLTLACMCNHIAQTRKELERRGYSIVKVGGGKYQLSDQRAFLVT